MKKKKGILFSVFYFLVLGFIGIVMLAALSVGDGGTVDKIVRVFLLIDIVLIITYIYCLIKNKSKKPYYVIFAIICIFIMYFRLVSIYNHNIETIREPSLSEYDYEPFKSNTKAVKLDESSTLFLKDNLPIIDGATALYPIYAAFVQATYSEAQYLNYKKDQRIAKTLGVYHYLNCSKTPTAYANLINKKVDMIFVLDPSDEQKALAEENGVTLKFTPIGKEAFIFFVNKKNEVDNLSISQIQEIYSGTITNWNEVGGKRDQIQAFQRNKNSGSQTALEELMNEKTIMEPDMVKINNMFGMIEEVANYRNYKNSIGFSFRFYATEMVQNNSIKLLKVNNVEPTVENIRNNNYPITKQIYAVTLEENENENVDKLIEWILSEQGQEIVEKTGYVGIQ